LIAEGFATAATLHEESGYRVYIAFTANNLMAVGRIVREKLPDAEIVFCADNDTKTPGNPGLTKATEAAQAISGSVAVPPLPGDFNDHAIYLKGLANE
jgi:putative DNA primase/helicase